MASPGCGGESMELLGTAEPPVDGPGGAGRRPELEPKPLEVGETTL